MYKVRKIILLLHIVFTGIVLTAQTASISGTVQDANGELLPGATIQLSGSNTGTVTDIDGNYNLSGITPGSYTLVCTYIGYQKFEEAITLAANQTLVKNIVLQDDALLLETAIVVGYGTTQVKDLTGSVTSVSAKDFNAGNVTTPEQLVTGKIAGVQITSNSGAPGSGSQIRIRGGTSLNASNDPLIVIDGVPVDNNSISGAANALNLVNADDIENITVLKDASAAAIYGSRAANGVIIITTKKATADNKLHIEFNTNNSVSQIAQYYSVLSADEFRAVVDSNGTATQQGLLGDANTDWQQEIFRTGIISDNDLTFYGGLSALPYRLNLEYMNEQGILERSQLSRMGISVNLSPTLLSNNLTVDANAKAYHTDNVFAEAGAVGTAITFDPTQPVYDETSPYGGYFEWLDVSGNPNTLAPKNPVGLIQQKDDFSDVNRFIGNLKLDYKMPFLTDLHGVLNVGTDISRSNGTVVIVPEAASNFNATTGGGLNNQYEQSKDNKLLEAYLNYTKDLNGIASSIDFTGGYSYQNWLTKSPAFASLDYDGDTLSPAGIPFETENTLISFYGRLNYNLKERYLLTATLREDGSSRFSPENRWGLFPSVALAWRVSEESFMQNSGVYLKLRLGYGITGQQDIFADYPYIPSYDSSTSTAQYQFGEAFYYLLRPEAYDENIKWEETESYNAGIDFGFIQDRLSGSIDIYKKNTYDLIGRIPVPAGTNFSNYVLTNVGSLENKGVEVNLNIVAIDKKDMALNFSANGTANRNKILGLTKAESDSSIGILVGGVDGGIGNLIQIQTEGYPIFTFFTYEQEYDEDGNPIEGVYVNQNGDTLPNGNPTYTIEDRVRGENPAPDFYAGFSTQFRYKKWTAAISMRGEFGNYVFNNVAAIHANYKFVGTSGYINNLTSDYYPNEFQAYGNIAYSFLSDLYVENASFIRMDNASIGYNVGSIFNDNATLSIAAIVQNVFLITNYSGIDPEIAGGIDRSIYPRPRIYSLNLNLKI